MSQHSIKQLSAQFDEPPVIVVNAPYWATFAIALRDATKGYLIYDVLDRFEHFEDLQNHAPRLMGFHDRLLKEADLVTYTARDMKDYVSKSDAPLYLPNGCDFELWNIGRNPKPKPIVGYMGVMAYWFDTAVVSYLMQQKEYHLKLAGSITKPNQKILWGNNNPSSVNQYMGIINYHKLPRTTQHWTVGLIPFKEMELTQATDPNKLYEYYALGLPVVATDLRELRLISETMPEEIRPVLLPSGKGVKWHRAIMSEIEGNTPAKIEARKAWASDNTWEHRFDLLMETANERSRTP
jgi:glycosyltransferase involved in cell wall biosynthesis